MLRRLLVVLVAALGTFVVQAQSILTVAGGGTLDGQLVQDIVTTEPRGIAFDHAGNFYLASRSGGYVVRVDARTSIATIVAGTGAAGYSGDGGLAVNATLRQPVNIAFDADDNLFIADSGNGRVRRVDAHTGIITTFAGGGTPQSGVGDGGPATSAALTSPAGVAIGGGGLFVAEYGYGGNRVRRIDLTTHVIDTYAGSGADPGGGFSGDNGPAKQAQLNAPTSVAFDASGNLYIADIGNGRIRRVDANGTITTYAADISTLSVLALDLNGNVLFGAYPLIQRIDKSTHAIATVFGPTGVVYGLAVDRNGAIFFEDDAYGNIFKLAPNATDVVVFEGRGKYVGDGNSPTAAILHSPQGLAIDRNGNLFIGDTAAEIVRKVTPDGTISTVAGILGQAYAPPEQEGTDAINAGIGFPVDVAIDPNNNLFIANSYGGVVYKVDSAGKLTTYAGGGSPADGVGDNGPATQARINPYAITFDAAGNLFIADSDQYATVPHARIRRVDAVTKVITTVAGSADLGTSGSDGDNGPATQAKLKTPVGVGVDADGNIFISDPAFGVIRRVDHASHVITRYAGFGGESDPLGDGGPATQGRLTPLHMTINRATGDLYVADFSSHRIRRIDRNGILSTVAGSATHYLQAGFSGDNGPATEAKLAFDYGDYSGIALDANGNVLFSDSQNNRVRQVLACRSVTAPALASPADNATSVATAPKLTWGAVSGALRYDVRLDTANPPVKVIATDVDETSFTPANLQPNTKYYWLVVAKGDRYCPAVASATSSVRSFTTTAACAAGAFDLTSPANGAQQVPGTPAHLTWQSSAGASSYDLYLGSTNPPPLLAAGITSTSYDTQVAGTAYWFVVAHAACDATKTATTPIASFTTTFTNPCGIAAGAVTAVSPANGATNVAPTLDLTWSTIGSVETFDVYFGTSTTPPLLRAALPTTQHSLTLPSLAAGTTYYWRIGANGPCVGTNTTPLQSFTTRSDCPTPGATQIIFAPPAVNAGATYAIVWSPAASLGADGGYLVERSTSPNFQTILDAQVSSSTAASFLAQSPGTLYHRVRAVPGCDVTKVGPASEVKSVIVSAAPPNVIFTVPPHAVITALGEKLEDQRGSFTLENIGASSVQVIVGRQEINSAPFFSIVDDAAFVTLEPRRPRTFNLRYSGPRNDVAGSYQGVIFVAATGAGGLAVTPYAFVNLKVGGGSSAVPKFVVDGVPSDYAAFPGFAGDDANRPPRQVTIRNDGTAPMELAAEIGPDVWLTPDASWNATALAPGASRTINLSTQRSRAPNGAALPRYTYFTVRTKDGASARLLVQDNDALSVRSGRSTVLDASTRTFIVPEVVSKSSSRNNRLVTRMRLTNVGGDAVQTELVFTPSGRDGFDAQGVARATVVVPPNDVVTITDPIVQLFGLTAPSSGAIEVRLPRERVGLIAVRSQIIPLGVPGGFDTPVVVRGEGARAGAPHVIHLLPSSTASLTIAETSGNDSATVRIVTFDANGNQTSTQTQSLPRYGSKRIDNLAAARIEVNVDSGGGSVIGLATIGSATGESGATVLSRAVTETTSTASAVAKSYKTGNAVTAISVTTVVPLVGAYKTSVGFVAPPSLSATFEAVLHAAAGGTSTTKSVTIPAGGSHVYGDIMSELFNVAPGQGSVFITSPSTSKVYAVLNSGPASTPAPSSFISLPTTLSEALTSLATAAQRTLAYDGLEQNTDTTKGDRWLLVLNEVSGASGSVNVRLYEAANRTSPIATRDFPVNAFQELTLDSVFAEMGLDAPDRRKDRTNVEVVVTATAGSARLSATAVAVSNETGEARSFTLTPAVGSGTPNIVFVTPGVVPGQVTPPPTKRRIVGH